MFATSPINGELLSSQWNVVLGTGLAFFIVQIALSIRLYFRMGQQARILTRLARDFEQGGDGRGNLHSLPKSFIWLRWIHSIFPAESAAPVGNFTRDDVLNELDVQIASNSDYLLLQRMGVMAPLLGVILTVVGFYWLKVDESDEQSLQRILLSVTPLVSGVGAGAALALINQVLLYGVGGRVESLRMLARTWFDTVIWRNVGLDSPAVTTKAIAALEQFTRSVAEAAERHAVSSGRIGDSTVSMQNAASSFHDVIAAFNAEINCIPQTLYDLRNATAASAVALEELIPLGKRAVANLDVSVAAFRTAIEREFTAAAKLHDQSSKVLAKSVQQIGNSTQSLKTSSDELKQTAQSNAAAFRRMDESLRQHLVPGTQHFFDAVNTLTGQIAVWGKVANALSTNVDAMTGELNKLSNGILPAVTSVFDAADQRMGQADAEHSKQVELVGRSTQQLRETANRLSEGTTALNALLHECAQFVDRAGAIQETLADTAKGLVGAVVHLQQTIESDVAPTKRIMHNTAASFAHATAQLTDFLEQGLAPAIKQLTMLRETVASLENAVRSIKDVSHAGANIDRLAEALTRASEITDEISTLPEQIRDVLEQSADRNTALAKSRGGLRSWLPGRPR